jgi:hypothetical protein
MIISNDFASLFFQVKPYLDEKSQPLSRLCINNNMVYNICFEYNGNSIESLHIIDIAVIPN